MTEETDKTQEFLADFSAMSAHGATEAGGVDRQAGTDADRATRAWFRELVTAHGGRVVRDAIGNQFGLFELAPDADWVLVGSHLDSQPMAGRFDGAYGVLAGAHAAFRTVEQVRSGQLNAVHNLAVVNWFNEEGSRFTPSMMGSSVYTGTLDLNTALETADRDGVTVAEELAGEIHDEGSVVLDDVAAYAEIHVEQGRILEEAGAAIGLVDRTWGAKKYRVTVLGEQGHTGSTLIRDRQDALYGAALLIVAARQVTEQFEEGLLHTAVSELELAPNSPVTLAREVQINLDLRSPDVEVLARAEGLLAEEIQRIEQRARVSVEQRRTHEWGLVAYPPEGVALAELVAQDLDVPAQRIMTVAGHDSTNMKNVVPTVMLFVPSVEGISHHESESTRDDDMLAGVDMLTGVVARMVGGWPTSTD